MNKITKQLRSNKRANTIPRSSVHNAEERDDLSAPASRKMYRVIYLLCQQR